MKLHKYQEAILNGKAGRLFAPVSGLDDPAWNRSVREEIVTALWLIAGLLAWQDNIKWLAWCLFVKAATDLMCCVFYAIVDSIREIAEKQRSSNDQAHRPRQ